MIFQKVAKNTLFMFIQADTPKVARKKLIIILINKPR